MDFIKFMTPSSPAYPSRWWGHLTDGMQCATPWKYISTFLHIFSHSAFALFISTTCDIQRNHVCTCCCCSLIPLILYNMDSDVVDSSEVKWSCGWGTLQKPGGRTWFRSGHLDWWDALCGVDSGMKCPLKCWLEAFGVIILSWEGL